MADALPQQANPFPRILLQIAHAFFVKSRRHDFDTLEAGLVQPLGAVTLGTKNGKNAVLLFSAGGGKASASLEKQAPPGDESNLTGSWAGYSADDNKTTSFSVLSVTGKEAQRVLDQAGITLNKNTIPNDPRSPFVTSGVRIGTPSVTTQGMKEPEMAEIAGLIAEALRARGDDAALTNVRDRVADLCKRFPVYA